MTGLRRVENRATWLLSQANTRAHTILAEALAAEGVRGYHYRLLAALDEYGASSQADLGRYASLDRSDVHTTVRELTTARLAERRPDPEDGRRNVVEITMEGTAKLRSLDMVVDDVQRAVLAPLTATEQKTLIGLLGRLDGRDDG